ncbi:MAG: nitrate oxidoreductase subunit beta [Candidatus Tectomicrobia bacterium]|nr:nitrate oxidoreductase subunit beta [Candidatus Tectomicrobia bacterium]
MAKVYNWQIGREMSYPYEQAAPKRQWAFVFNINRCIACQTCTFACKATWTFSKGQEYMWWNNVETKPYGGYPQFWDIKLLTLLDESHRKANRQMVWNSAKRQGEQRPYGTYEGMTIFEAAEQNGLQQEVALGYEPSDAEWSAPNIYEDTATGLTSAKGATTIASGSLPEHKAWFFYLQRVCNHCSYPACLAACPRKAIYKRPEDGIVLIDQERCRGYRKCVMACPYKKSLYRPTTRTSEKCVACYPRIEGKDPLYPGQPLETRCMSVCPGRIRMQGLVKKNADGSWAEDRQNPLYFLVKVAKVALPLYPQFGLEPNGYYIPPRWAPRPYLRQMFGPGVEEAIAAYTAPSRELLAVLQLFRTTQQIIFRYEIIEGPKVFETTIQGKKWQMYNDTVVGYGQDGREVTRVAVEEGLQVRPNKHANSI